MTLHYRPVYQTWSFVRPPHGLSSVSSASHTASDETSTARRGPATNQDAPRNLRARVQESRIARRWSINTLAVHAKCDPVALADFERGEQVLDDDVLARVFDALLLEGGRATSKSSQRPSKSSRTS